MDGDQEQVTSDEQQEVQDTAPETQAATGDPGLPGPEGPAGSEVIESQPEEIPHTDGGTAETVSENEVGWDAVIEAPSPVVAGVGDVSSPEPAEEVPLDAQSAARTRAPRKPRRFLY